MREEDKATDIGNMHKKFSKDRAWFWGYPRGQTDSQTDRQTDILITILCIFQLYGGGAIRIILASASLSIRAIYPNLERCRDWIIAVRSGCLVAYGVNNLSKVVMQLRPN